MTHKKLIAAGGCLALLSLAIILPVYAIVAEFNKAAGALHALFQIPPPEINVTQFTAFYGFNPTLEVATETGTFNHRFRKSISWLGSTKEVDVEGDFIAKAGFDARSGFYAEISPLQKLIILRIPEPRILSVELIRPSISELNGYWNWIQDADRTKALDEFVASARAAAERNTQLKTRAVRSLKRELSEYLANVNSHYTVRYEEIIDPLKPEG